MDYARKQFAEAQKFYNLHRGLLEATNALLQRSAIQSVESMSSTLPLIEHLERNEQWLQASIGWLNDIQRLGAHTDHLSVGLSDELLAQVRQLVVGYESRFWLPNNDDITRLISENERAVVLQHYGEAQTHIRQAMDAMQTPWVEAQDPIRSLVGFADIQYIGHLLTTAPAFSDMVSASLRTLLGDWREATILPEDIEINVLARIEFYKECGFNMALTNFPLEAFRESLERAGLHDYSPTEEARDDWPFPPVDNDQEEGFARTNDAHNMLQRLEWHLRRFIDRLMTSVYGAAWAQQKLPNGMYAQWQEKQAREAAARREPAPLIDYADFSDYVSIICKRDHWREVFQTYFENKESVAESFRRLSIIRICTMHARPITMQDELCLEVEIYRLMSVIGDNVE